ncbi:MAG: hypothetical protein B7Y74_13300, partial [Novosphingobium sp. 35-62-5]
DLVAGRPDVAEVDILAALALFDARADEIEPVLRAVYGRDTALWMRRWRLFYLATAGLFGNSGGREWGVSHWRLKPATG